MTSEARGTGNYSKFKKVPKEYKKGNIKMYGDINQMNEKHNPAHFIAKRDAHALEDQVKLHEFSKFLLQ